MKAVDFEVLAARQRLFWRLCWVHLLLGYKQNDAMDAAFEPMCHAKAFAPLRRGLDCFLSGVLAPWIEHATAAKAGLTQQEYRRLPALVQRARLMLAV
jgi:hypothetical protein